MGEARDNYNRRRTELLREARAACFGRAPRDPERLVAWRDSRDRAEALTDKQTADQQMRKALDADDELLAKAIAETAHDRGWGRQVSLRAVPVELLAALSELERPPNNRQRTHEIFRWNLSR
jgi:hypothetical protein